MHPITSRLAAVAVLLVFCALPLAGDGPAQIQKFKRITFTDTSAPVCDVGDALGPGAVPDCGPTEQTACSNIGCPFFDIVDIGPIAGDVNGQITVCIKVLGPPDSNLFLPVNGCVLIEEDDESFVGPFTATFNLVHGAYGDYFVRSGKGNTIRATFTQTSVPGDPPLFFNTGTLIRPPSAGDDDDDDN